MDGFQKSVVLDKADVGILELEFETVEVEIVEFGIVEVLLPVLVITWTSHYWSVSVGVCVCVAERKMVLIMHDQWNARSGEFKGIPG